MGTTCVHAVASLDGYIAGEDDDVGPLHDWYVNGDHPLVEHVVVVSHRPRPDVVIQGQGVLQLRFPVRG